MCVEVRAQFIGNSSLFPPCPRDWIFVVRLGGKHLCLLNNLCPVTCVLFGSFNLWHSSLLLLLLNWGFTPLPRSWTYVLMNFFHLSLPNGFHYRTAAPPSLLFFMGIFVLLWLIKASLCFLLSLFDTYDLKNNIWQMFSFSI